MSLTSGFFKTQEEYSVIYVGGEQFHAAAVALIDSWKSILRGNDVALKKIWDCFHKYYPMYANNQTAPMTDRMDMLLKNSRKSEIVDCMAFILRQLAVTELYAHPLNYQMAFNGLDEHTPTAYLRDPETPIHACVFAALAQSLGLSITLSFKEPGKELRKCEHYVYGDNKPALEIQVQGDAYFPRVKHKQDFNFVGQLAIKAPIPAEIVLSEDETLAAIITLIRADNKQYNQSCEQWRNNLLTMVAAEDLTTLELLNLYTTFLPEYSHRLPAKQITIAGAPVSPEQRMVDLLVNALAAGISSGQLAVEQLFERDEPSVSTAPVGR